METYLKIPCLPGYSIDVNPGQGFRKRQHFDCKRLREVEPIANDDRVSLLQVSVAQSKQKENESVEAFVPKWMSCKGVVLRFFMYEIEKRFSKKFALYFYLEDDSLSIGEIPDCSRLSSGPPPREALFLRRQRVPNFEAKKDFVANDFAVGRIVVIFGRRFHIYSCDEFTRKWYVEASGLELLPNEKEPEDNLFPIFRPNPLIPRDKRLFNPADYMH